MTTKLTVLLLVLAATSGTKSTRAGQRIGYEEEEEEEAPPIFIDCSNDVTDSSEFCYIYVDDLKTRADAERNCVESYGAKLASVHSMTQQETIEETIRKVKGCDPETWIGGTDENQEGVWGWSDGSPFDFNYFGPGQPDNSPPAHCMVMNYGVHRRWDDQPCDFKKVSLCAKKL